MPSDQLQADAVAIERVRTRVDIARGEHTAAERRAQRLVEAHGEPEDRILRSVALARLGRTEAAIDCVRAALEQIGDCADPCLARAGAQQPRGV